jgi:hypothetical protein
LSEIGGYEVYYFEEEAPQGKGETIRITAPENTEVTIPGLMPGTYHFAIASYDSEGQFSAISEYVTAVLPAATM